MPLIIILVALVIVKYFEVGPFVDMSWWWVAGVALAAFLWFEFFERMLGLDARKSHEELERARAERVKKAFKKK